ncbi:MAG: NADH-quinone oxidoreductase subunit NuoK [Candidatus Omnitrophica bacterium]|nr:NADH-quinone oxidoreductase subunit NuoK [Candidatus Omnitrophota bacterium]
MSVQLVLALSNALFAVGVYGLLTRRNAVALLLAVELLLNAAALNFVLFGRLFNQVDGQAATLFIIALAACEAVAGLAIVINLFRTAQTVDADAASLLKG